MTRPAGPLPPVILLTDRRHAAGRGHSLTSVVRRAAAAGAWAVILREKELPRPERAAVSAELSKVLRPLGAALLVAGDAALAVSIGAAGVHLSATDPPIPDPGLLIVGRSCHTMAEVDRAAAEGCAYVTVSPVFSTESKPGYGPALGLATLAAMCEHATIPIYALGGIRPGRVRPCLDAGAAGVAVMGAVMEAADPGAVVRSLLEEATESVEAR